MQQRCGGGVSSACAGNFLPPGGILQSARVGGGNGRSWVSTDGRKMMVIWDGHREAVGGGTAQRSSGARSAARSRTAPPRMTTEGRRPCRPRPLTHAPSNATNTSTYAPLSLVEDGGTTVLIASSSAIAAPVATSTVAAAEQTKPKATLTMPFVKLNTLLN